MCKCAACLRSVDPGVGTTLVVPAGSELGWSLAGRPLPSPGSLVPSNVCHAPLKDCLCLLLWLQALRRLEC